MKAQRDFEGGLIGSRIVALIRQNIIAVISCFHLLSLGAAEFPAVRSVELSNIHAPQEGHFREHVLGLCSEGPKP